jgi:Domain of unknown function (DUF4406)/Domain of unknown function (DUF6378)
MNKIVYLSGPMTGIPEYNFPAFNAAAKKMREAGFDVLNPAELFDGKADRTREEYFRHDFKNVAECDIVLLLPDWEKSVGAVKELIAARECGCAIWRWLDGPVDTTPVPKCHAELAFDAAIEQQKNPETICQEADRLVSIDRQQAYGHPADDFERTGKMWGAILGIAPVPPPLVAMCMVVLKVSRQVNKPKRDNLTDIAGYAKCADLIDQRG